MPWILRTQKQKTDLKKTKSKKKSTKKNVNGFLTENEITKTVLVKKQKLQRKQWA